MNARPIRAEEAGGRSRTAKFRPAPPSAPPRRPLERYVPNPKLRFLDQCQEVMRYRQFSLRTEEAYVDWIRRLIV